MGQIEVRSRMDKPLIHQEGSCIHRHNIHTVSHHNHM